VSFGFLFVAQVQCLTLEQVEVLVKDQIEVLVKDQIEVLVEDQIEVLVKNQVEALVKDQVEVFTKSLKAENRLLKDQLIHQMMENQLLRDKLINSDKNDCPCDLTYLEDWLRENSIDITSLRVHTALLEESKSPIGTIIAWVPKVQQNKSSVIELPLGN
jgi:hypothetical protein